MRSGLCTLQSPPCITILLSELVRLGCPAVGNAAFLDGRLLGLAVALTRRSDDRGIDDLARHRQMSTCLEMRLESGEQLADCSGASELLPEQPNRLRIRHPVVKPEPEEAHEGQAVLDLELSRVVGQRVQGLEHQDHEHQNWVIGWAPTPRSIRARERRQQRAPENLELDQ